MNWRLTDPPRLRHPDNFAIVPASLLPFRNEWKAIVDGLPQSSALIVSPSADTPSKKILDTVASLLEAEGHHVTTISANIFTP